MVFEKGEALGKCAFCGINVVRREYLSSENMPEYVIPFVIKEDEARDLLKKWCDQNRFKSEAKRLNKVLSELKGFYLPYEMLSGPIHMGVRRMDGSRIYSCEGFIEDEFVNCSKQLDNLLLDGMEPYDINELKELVVYVPTYFILGLDVYQVMKDDSDGTKYPESVFDASTNTMTLTTFSSNQKGVHVIIALKGVFFNTENERDQKNDYFLKMDEKGISMEGGVQMKAVYEISASARGNRAPANKDLRIDCKTKVGDITIEGGKGNFKPDIDLKDGFGNFSIGELPDFLDDEEVKLKVKNPRIVLNISNDINLYGLVSESFIVAKMKDGSEKKVAVQPFKIKRHEIGRAHV